MELRERSAGTAEVGGVLGRISRARDRSRAARLPPAAPGRGRIVFVAAHQGGRIVAGAVANRTGEVVGLSNVFAPAQDAAAYWAGCVASAMGAFPGLPLVGYERGADLSSAEEAGFSRLGPLRVWIRRPTPGE